MILELADGETTDDLEAQGIVVFYRRDNLVLCCVPDREAANVASAPNIVNAAVSKKVHTYLDKARPATDVLGVSLGAGLPRAFTGKGVTLGFSDTGFDPGHIAFKGRVAGVSHFVDSTATQLSATTPAELADWTTDSPDQYHATHVGGIMVGCDESSLYQGVALGARLYATTSGLDDVCILAGVERVIEEAKKAGEPCVVNLSLGTKIGPRDGSDLFCRYLDLCAQDATILLAAGNDGQYPISTSKTLSESDSIMSVMVKSSDWNDTMEHNAYLDMWSSDHRPVEMRIRVWDAYSKEVVHTTDWVSFPDENLVWSIDNEEDAAFGKYLTGYALAAAETSQANGRYNLLMLTRLRATVNYPDQPWSRYNIIIDYKGEPSARLDFCVEGQMWVTVGGEEPVAEPGSSLSISSMACGKNTVAVGSYTSRDTGPNVLGAQESWKSFVQANTVSQFTSYGHDFDGRALPHFMAPGAYVISAFSRHYLEAHPQVLDGLAAESPGASGNYYLAECGTSMATPHAAGIFALWLEADPTLSTAELRDIAMETATTSGIDIDDPRAGAGLINAMAGMRKILASLDSRSPLLPELTTVRREGSRAVVDGEDVLAVEVFTIDGRRADPDNLPPRPVIVRVTTAAGVISKKI